MSIRNLNFLLRPRSVAVIGASDTPHSVGATVIRNMLSGGFAGPVWPVNLRHATVAGQKAYQSVDKLPEAPDLALLAVGGNQVAPMLEQCVRKGVRAAIAIAAGFSETGASGAEAERGIARIATEGGVTLMGPNCMGVFQGAASGSRGVEDDGVICWRDVQRDVFVADWPRMISRCSERATAEAEQCATDDHWLPDRHRLLPLPMRFFGRNSCVHSVHRNTGKAGIAVWVITNHRYGRRHST